MANIEVVEYLQNGISIFKKWFISLDAKTAAKVTTALYRLEQGNVSNVKSVGKGVSEYRIDLSTGHRIYFGREGNTLIILLGGSVKKTQDRDIRNAKLLWAQYKKDKEKKK